MTAPKIHHRRGMRHCLKQRQGAILVVVAILLPVFLLIVGFSVDLALMQSVRTETRAVADLSAKAAAGELSRTQNVAKARAAARDVAGSNLIAGAPVSLENQDIVFGNSAPQPDGSWAFQAGGSPLNSIEVNVRRTSGGPNGAVGMVFGRLYGRATMEHQMAATASFLDVDVCLVLDRSSSMKLSTTDPAGGMSGGDPRQCVAPWADSRWVAVENAVSLFITQLQTTPALEHVALVTFASDFTSPCGETNTEASVDRDLLADLTLINQAMSNRSNTVWNGNTNIDAGIRVARNVLTGPQARNMRPRSSCSSPTVSTPETIPCPRPSWPPTTVLPSIPSPLAPERTKPTCRPLPRRPTGNTSMRRTSPR